MSVSEVIFQIEKLKEEIPRITDPFFREMYEYALAQNKKMIRAELLRAKEEVKLAEIYIKKMEAEDALNSVIEKAQKG